jgi:hypothetical protein
VLGLAACAALAPPRDLVAAAIRARGGPLASFARESEADVHYGFPGLWRWRIEFRAPDRMRFTLHTDAEDQHWVSDGRSARVYLGSALVSSEPLEGSCVATVARWIALIHLDVLADPARFRWRELSRAELPADAARGLIARCPAGGADEYRLLFDGALRLVAAEGPISIPGIGEGRFRARFSDFRRVQGFLLPFAATYTFDGEPFFDERVLSYQPGAPVEPGAPGAPGAAHPPPPGSGGG